MAKDDFDLPLMANVTKIVVQHYILNLVCDFEKKIFAGNTVLYLEPAGCSQEQLSENSKGFNCCHCQNFGVLNIGKSDCNQRKLSEFASISDKTCRADSESVAPCTESELRNLNINECVYNEPSEDIYFQGNSKQKQLYSNECRKSELGKKEFMCILDCCHLSVKSVEELEIDIDEFMLERFSPSTPKFVSKQPLSFLADEWSLQIWKKGVHCQFCFPKFIRIKYETVPEGSSSSLLWVKDQDGKPAVFTYGAWINNRALFPCQEPPPAMATWSATISTCSSAVVLMSSDTEPVVHSDNGLLHYFFYSKAALPMATLSLAVGFWKGERILESRDCGNTLKVPCRIFASSSLLENAMKEFSDYVVQSVKTAVSILGEYPFPRIDILVVPKGFASLGMASPNIIFLSQSLLAGDKSMCIRVAHEVAHAWFGLLIGAFDWTEEWLSEGFATFMEDHIHTRAVCMSSSQSSDYVELKSFLRCKILQAEMQNVEPELLKLRPTEGKLINENINGTDAVIVKNGQNPDKAFIQVHYLKGYFILKHLSNLVGLQHFLDFLKSYVDKYRGQLVGSKEFFEMFIKTYPDTCKMNGVTVDGLIKNWLHSPKIPEEVLAVKPSDANNLFKTTYLQLKRWKTTNRALLRSTYQYRKRKRHSFDNYDDLDPLQLVLLLEELLEECKLSTTVMRNLEKVYNLSNANADIRHRWCELVVKHQYSPGYVCLNRFLQEDLAMGVYLYSELIFSGISAQRRISEECFKLVMNEMEPNQLTTVNQMMETASH